MKKVYMSAALAALLFTACGDKHEEKVQKPTVMEEKSSETSEAIKPAPGEELYGVPAEEAMNAAPNDSIHNQHHQPGAKEGVVVETMDAGVYTYAKVKDANGEYWIAGPKTEIEVGEKISFAPQMWMENFPSKTLNRTFDKILFVAVIAPLKGDTTAHNCENCGPEKESTTKNSDTTAKKDSAVTQVEKAEGGYTVAEIFEKSSELKDKTVKVNGKVTKVVRGVMGKDWVHISDGTGKEGSSDLVVTSPVANVKEGETVTVTGRVKTDVDFGYGYFYPVLIEDANFEKAG